MFLCHKADFYFPGRVFFDVVDWQCCGKIPTIYVQLLAKAARLEMNSGFLRVEIRSNI